VFFDCLCFAVNLIEQMVISLGSWMGDCIASSIINLTEVCLMNINKSLFTGVGAIMWGPCVDLTCNFATRN
jgi:hypothetical protein